MGTYFIFSDEYGEYNEEKSPKILKAHPYYIRAALIISSEEWKAINNKMRILKEGILAPYINIKRHEIKWSYMWNKRCYEEKNELIPENKPYHFLNNIKYDDLFIFIDQVLEVLSGLKYCKVILTITVNKECSIKLYELHRWHIEAIMQRVEMELEPDNLGIVFIDPVSTEKNKLLRNIYHDLYINNFFIEHKCIKDSLNIEHSHHSVCIQIVDYIAGCFGGFMKGFQQSTALFNKRIRPFLRCSKENNILGYGISEVPRNNYIREIIAKKLIL